MEIAKVTYITSNIHTDYARKLIQIVVKYNQGLLYIISYNLHQVA